MLPYSTDAPLYHLPFVTVGLIVVNILAFVGMLLTIDFDNADAFFDTWALNYGTINPIQWVTSNFVHGGVFHLLGNMFSLWAFGLVVEGKVGWWRMLAIVAIIGVGQCALEQLLMFFAGPGASFGFSAIVFGLMAICLIWAPENEMSVITVFFYVILTFDITIYTLATILFLLELGALWFSGLAVSSALLHLMGGGIGLAIGYFMFKWDWVDCENWDVFSCWKGENRLPAEERERLKAEQPADKEAARRRQAERAEHAAQQFRAVLANRQPQQALKLYETMRHQHAGWQLPEPDLRALVQAFHEQQLWVESIPAMIAYMHAYPAGAPAVRLKLAQILVVKAGRPAQALRVLDCIDPSVLPAEQQQLLHQLRRRAEEDHKLDPYEIVDEDWR